MTQESSDLVVGLDIGTSKASCIIGEIGEDGAVNIVGVNEVPSKGLLKGVVVDVSRTREAIHAAVENASTMASCEVGRVMVSISGGHIKCQNAMGSISLNERDDQRSLKEVTRDDIRRVIESAKANLSLEAGREIIHVIPQEYTVDTQDGIRNPVGMSGMNLKVKVHVVTCNTSALTNIKNCVLGCGLEISDVVFQPIASGEACLSEDDRDMGVCLVDIGHGTTDVSVYSKGALIHSAVIASGGADINNDLALLLQVPMDAAESIKQKYGQVVPNEDDDEKIELPSLPGWSGAPRLMAKNLIREVVAARVAEIINLVYRELQRCGIDPEGTLGAGLVITGGGANIADIAKLTEEITHLHTRVGIPQKVSGLEDLTRDPKAAACVGLVLMGAKDVLREDDESDEPSLLDRFREFMSRFLA